MSSSKHRSVLMLSSALTAVLFAGAAPALAEDATSVELVVTGSRIARSGFTTPTPVTVLGSQQLENLNVTNAAVVLNQLPAFRPSTNPQTNGFGSFNVGGQFINLRGLGVSRNLVLVDGRRFPPVTREGTADLNLIPSGLIERLDVVTGGASAAYGSDAVAGVVNIILAKRLNGLRGQLDAGVSEAGDGADYHAFLAGGADFGGGKGHIIAGGEWDKQLGIGSCFTREWCKPSVAALSNTGGAATGLPPLVRSDNNGGFLPNQSGVISALNNTGTQGVNTAAIRALFGTGGVTFDTTGQAVPFHQGSLASGTSMIGGDLTPSQQFTQVLVPSERHTLYSHAEYAFSDKLTGFLEGSYGHTEGVTLQSVYFGNPLSIFVDNPFIPAQIRALLPGAPAASANPSGTRPGPPAQVVSSAAAFNLARLGDRRGISSSDADSWRIAGGFNGKLTDTWGWDAYYQYAHTNRTQAVANALVTGASRVINRPGSGGVSDPASLAYFLWAIDAVYNPADAALPASQRRIICRVTISPDPALRAAAAGCQPLNPFGKGRASDASLDYVYRDLIEDISISQHVAAVNLRGELFNLPGGPLAVAAGGEYRRDSTRLVHDQLSNSFAYFQNFGADYDARQSVIEGYVEGDAPLLRDAPLAHSLNLNGAVRQTHYSIKGVGGSNHLPGENTIDATTWKVGIVWEPTDWLRLRATRSRDIRAPNFFELFQASASNFTALTNRLQPGNPTVFPPQVNGGNPDLQAEKASTWTVGAVLAPRAGMLEGLRASADYYDIKVDGFISSAGGAQSIIDRCAAGNQSNCDLIVRDNANNIQEVRNINLNLQWLRTKGLDIEADYRLPLEKLSHGMPGSLDFRTLVTLTFESATNTYGVVVDRAGETGAAGIPDYLINSSVTYASGPISATLQARYIPDGLFDASRVGPDQPGYSLTNVNAITDNHVDGRLYFNLYGSYNILHSGERRLQVFGTVNNLFNNDPPSAPQLGYSTNPIYFDQIGRQFRLGLRFDY
jgi:iron complex outermembrane receptor protein